MNRFSWGMIRAATSLAFIFSLGCTKKEADPIVIPPGQLVEYSTGEFVSVSKTYYSVELQKLDEPSQKFFSLQDVTPSENKDQEQSIRFIVPKDLNAPGLFVVKVNMPRSALAYSAFVVPERIARPSLASTMAVELFANYPGLKLQEIDISDVIAVEDELRAMILRAKAEYGIDESFMTAKAWSRFIHNYGLRDARFLALAESLGLEFSVDGQGQVNGAPYPFGNANKSPTLDAGNSTARVRPVAAREAQDVHIRARVQDEEGDEVVFRWFLDGVEKSKDPDLFTWTPGYFDSKTDPYVVKLLISDGSIPVEFDWNVVVEDSNRPPEVLSSCDLKTKEWVEWSCTIKAIDFDKDPLTFTVTDKTTNARALVEGQQTDDTTRKIAITGKDSITIKFTPNNFDARKRAAYIEVAIDDGKLGQTFVPLNLTVEDINSPPQLIYIDNGAGGKTPIQPFVPGDVAREWDYCADQDPDGGQPYRFMVEVRDPDNQPDAFPRSQNPDVVSVTFGGTLKDALKQLTVADGCPASTDEHSYFCFEWKPRNIPRSGTLTLTLKDDHGGVVQMPSDDYPDPIILTSEDRNVRPCLTASAVAPTLSDNLTLYSDSFSGEDPDEVSPAPELADTPFEVIPLLRDAVTSGNPRLVFHQTFFNPSSWIMRFAASGSGPSSARYFVDESAALSGLVVFSRTAAHTADLTIPAGTIITTSTPTMKIDYQVAQAVVMAKDDKAVTVPVVATHRSVAIGKLKRFIAATPFTATVTNSAAIAETQNSGTVTVTRTSSTATAQTLPAGTEIGTDEVADGLSTIRFVTMDNDNFDVGVTSKSVRIARKKLTAAVGTVTSMSTVFAGPAISVSNPIALTGRSAYTLVQERMDGSHLGIDKFCWARRVVDATVTPAGVVFTASSGLPADVKFLTTADTGLEGWLTVQRTSTAAALTVPQGTVVRAHDATQYALGEAAILGAGQASVTVRVARANHANVVATAGSDSICASWQDLNYSPVFLNASSAKVNEGALLPDFQIRVTDNTADEADPKDPLDRHTFTITPVAAPVGPYMLCRSPGTDASNINVPACVPCTTEMSTYFESAVCYFRFKPDLQDVAQTFTFKITANDNSKNDAGYDIPVDAGVRDSFIIVSVIEHNDPPVLTDSGYAPLTGGVGTAKDNAYSLGQYLEGTDTLFLFYLTDPDRGADSKTLMAPSLVRTWQYVSPSNTWVTVTNPSGLALYLAEASVYDSSGVGSRTREVVRWKASDADAKRLAGTAGFVMELKVCDRGNSDSPSQCTTGFFKATVKNQQNAPFVSSSTPVTGSAITVTADKYFQKDFTVQDLDYANNAVNGVKNTYSNSTFEGHLSFCSNAGVYSCAADLTGWPVVFSSPDSPYAGNLGVANCQSSAGVFTANLYPQFVLPAVGSSPTTTGPAYTGTSGSVVTNGSTGVTTRNFTYSFRWCPQRKHIGKHIVTWTLRDNGDEDYTGSSSAYAASVVPLSVQLSVVAPVFFDSPVHPTGNEVATLWMKQAYSFFEYRYVLRPNVSKGNPDNIKIELLTPGVANSKMIGDVSLETRTNAAPTTVLASSVAVANASGVPTTFPSLTNINPSTTQVHLVWKPYGATPTTSYVSDPADQNTWPLFRIRVTDLTTNETDTVQFRVQVKNPSGNVAPTISSFFPAQSSVALNEQVPQAFSVTATDSSGEYLHYRWWLDGKLVSDSSASYTYLPAMDDAFTAATGLAPGQHTLTVEVTDGVERTGTSKVYQSWNIQVRNTTPMPVPLAYSGSTTTWTMANWSTSGVSVLNWGPSIGVATKSVSGTTTTTNNHLVFAGSYTRSGAVKQFITRLQFTNGAFTSATSAGAGALVKEILPWASGRKSEGLSFIMTDAANIQYLLATSIADPSGLFTATTDAVRLPVSLPSSVTSSNACTGSCAWNFLKGFQPNPTIGSVVAGTPISSSTEAAAAYTVNGNAYYFYSSNLRATISYSLFAGTKTDLATLTGNDKIGDIAVNADLKRLYVTVRDPSAATPRNFLRIYNLSPLPSGPPTLVTTLTIATGNPSDDVRVIDLALDLTKKRVYMYLPGTGGVAYVNDDGLTTPTQVYFKGVAEISEAPTASLGTGRKLVFNPTKELLYGIVGNQVFIIDTYNDAFGVKTYTNSSPMDELISFANDGLTLALDKTNGLIYLIR